MGRLYLLVDDDADDADIFERALKIAAPDINLTHLTEGLGTFYYLNTHHVKPDLIFLDINLFDISGWQCLIQLKSHHDYQHIPVIMFSSSYAPDDHEMARLMGAVGLLCKPDSYRTMIEMLREISQSAPENLEEVLKKF